VNFLIYLANQLLKGCQSADNQFQALENQEIEGFSVHGSLLPELEAKVLQIQFFIWISLRYSISVDQRDSVLGGLFSSSLVGYLQTLLSVPFVLDYRTFLSMDFIYYVYPCPVETSRGSILLLWSFYTLFTLCPFETKRGSICLIWIGIVFLTRSSDFCPRMAKEEFVSFCVGCILLDKITIM